MNHMNISILSVDYQPQYLGGIKRVTTILGMEWQKLGYECSYLTICPSPLKVNNIKSISQFFFPQPNSISSKENEQYFINYILDHQIDIILNPHVEEKELTHLAIRVHQLTGVKLISALHFSPNHNYNIIKNSFFISYSLETSIKKWIKTTLLWCKFHLYKGKLIQKSDYLWLEKVRQSSDCFVVLSNKYLHYFKNDKNNIIAINNPIDPDISNIPISKKSKNVVWCGRLDIIGTKRVDRILRIWKKLYYTHKDWTLYLLGSGDIKHVKKLINDHKIGNVEVVGFCDPYEYFSKASIVTMTSTTEGWGMVLVESQSLGCVPIAFDSYESIHDIIQHEKNGILVKPFDLDEYACQLERLMDDEEYRGNMANEVCSSVQKFDVKSIAEQWEELFMSIISENT